MMCLSQTAGYAIHALSMVAQGGGRLCLIREIARVSGIPKPYLAKIVNQLAREGLVTAKRGYRGGIYLTRPPREITLLEVVEAIDGKDFIAECMLGLNECTSPCLCPTQAVWTRLREEIRGALSRTSLANILEMAQAAGNPAQCQNGVPELVAFARAQRKVPAGRKTARRPQKSSKAAPPPVSRRRRSRQKSKDAKIYDYYD